MQEADLRMLLVHIGTIMKGGKPVWTDKDEENLARIDDKLYQGILPDTATSRFADASTKRNIPLCKVGGTAITSAL